MQRGMVGLLTLAALALGGCSGDAQRPQQGPVFVVEVSGERFRVRPEGAEAIAALRARMASGEEGVVMGRLAAGGGGFNAPWSWHLDPATVEVPDVSIELCDGRPSMVEDDLTYWLETVKSFCPWGAKVVAEE